MGESFAGVLTILLSLVYFDSLSEQVPIDEDRLVRGLSQVAIVTARGAADVRYDEIVYDRRSRTISVEGVYVSAEGATFEIEAARIANYGDDDTVEIHVEIDGLSTDLVNLDLPPPVMLNASLAGLETVVADGEITLVYDIAQSAATSSYTVDIENVGRLTATTDLVGLHLVDDGWDQRPAGQVDRVTLAFEDDGVTGQLMGLYLGAQEVAPEMAAQLSEQAGALYLQALSGAEFDQSFDPAQADPAAIESADRLKDEVARYLVEQDRIAITIDPAEPIDFDEAQALLDEVALDPTLRLEVFKRLQPRLSAAPLVAIAPISGERLQAASTGGYGVQPAETLALAEALLTGRGAPKSLDQAIDLALGGAAQNDPRALMILAAGLFERGAEGDMEDAYLNGLRAQSLGAAEAGPMVSKIESHLDVAAILRGQDAASDGFAPGDAYMFDLDAAEDGDGAAMRRLALAHESGDGAPRSLTEAYKWALLGAAAGDRPAERLRDRVAARFDHADAEEAALWRATLRDVETEALTLWTDGLGAAAAAAAE